MKILRRSERSRLILSAAVALLSLAMTAQGCALYSKIFPADEPDLEDAAGNEGEPLPPPVANVGVTYKRPGDSLVRATVIKFFGANVLSNHQRDATHTESTVRFEGGVPIWEFKTTESTLGSFTGVGNVKYAVKSIEYSKVPQHFTQIIPEEGPPEPLDRGSYYVFQIERQSGSTSYQAVKVLADGSLQAYTAQPRAGSSYLLCCNITTDFPEAVVLPEMNPDESTDTSTPTDTPPDDSSGSGGADPGAPSP